VRVSCGKEDKTQKQEIAPDYVKGMAVRICCMAGVVILMLIFLRFHVKIPEDMIPTKWSDFAFWRRWGEDKAERMPEMDSFFHGQTCAECAVNLFKKVKDYEKCFCIQNFLYEIT